MDNYRWYLMVILLAVIPVVTVEIVSARAEARGAMRETPAEAHGHPVRTASDPAVPLAPDDTHIITFANFSYTPAALTIRPGDTVEWQGSFSGHPLVSDGGLWTMVGSGVSFSHTFNTPGVYRYHCFFHGGPNGQGMSGMITVEVEDIERIPRFLPLVIR